MSRTQGTKIATEELKGRVLEAGTRNHTAVHREEPQLIFFDFNLSSFNLTLSQRTNQTDANTL